MTRQSDEFQAWWDELAQARQQLVRAALRGQLPPRLALTTLENWTDELTRLPAEMLSDDQLAQIWGNLQLILVECGVENGTAEEAEHNIEMAWQRVRRAAEQAFQGLLTRPELASVQVDLRNEVVPLLADAVPHAHEGRITRCIGATRHLHALMLRTSGAPHAWRLARIAAMQYPYFTFTGWHGRMGIDFTWPRARLVAQALISALRESGLGDLPLIIGYDSRAHAGAVAAWVTEVAVANGQPVHLCSRDTPAPALIAYGTNTLGVANHAGVIDCTASRLPVKDSGTGIYSGVEYQGMRYYTPYGTPASAEMNARISRRAAELLLEQTEIPHVSPSGTVSMIDPLPAQTAFLVSDMGYPVPTVELGSEPAHVALQRFWQRPTALILIDEMHGAARGYLRAVCDELALPYEVVHGGRDPLFGELTAANPEPPQVAELMARVREVREERHPMIGLAFDADGDRFGVVDETGTYLPGNAVLALLTDYFLNEAYPGEPGMLIRDFTATRMVDRLAQLPEYVDRVIPPPNHGALPAYMRAPGYRQLIGDPAALHGSGVHVTQFTHGNFAGLGNLNEILQRQREGKASARNVQEALYACLDRVLIAGDAHGGIVAHGHAPDRDGLWAALLLLQLCAVRQAPVGELWRRLQEHIGPSYTERLHLTLPMGVKLPLVNRYLQHYAKAGRSSSPGGYKMGGCPLLYAGGVEDRFVEWALRAPSGQPAYLTVQVSATDPIIHAIAEGSDHETPHRLLITVAERVEALIIQQLRQAENAWRVVETLANIQLPPAALYDLPGTLNCRIAQQAYARLQELAHPGREAPELLQFVTDRLAEMQPEKSRVLAACRLAEQPGEKRTPPTPRLLWEGEEER